MTEEKSLKLLEFDKITALLANHAETEGGRLRCLSLLPTDDKDTAQEWQDFTEAALYLYDHKGTFTMTRLPDMTDTLNRLKVSGILSPQELYGVARILDAARRLRTYKGDEETALDDYIERLRSDKVLEEKIRRAFSGDGEVLDSASDELYRIRRAMQSA